MSKKKLPKTKGVATVVKEPASAYETSAKKSILFFNSFEESKEHSRIEKDLGFL